MAAADYRLCDVCTHKVFYDSNLSYEFGPFDDDTPQALQVGEPACYSLGSLGDWGVLCSDCSKTNRVVIVDRHPPDEPAPTEAREGEVMTNDYLALIEILTAGESLEFTNLNHDTARIVLRSRSRDGKRQVTTETNISL